MASGDVFLDDIPPAGAWTDLDRKLGIDSAHDDAMRALSSVVGGELEIVPISDEHPDVMIIQE